MSYLLELLGKGLELSLMELVLPFATPLTTEDVKKLSEAVSREPAHTANKLRLGIHYAQSGATGNAERTFSQILEFDPKHLDARLAWAAMYASDGALDKAIEHLQLAAELHESDARIYFSLAHCHERKGDEQEALKYYYKTLEYKPVLRQARERIAAIYLHDNNVATTVEQCQILMKEYPEDVWTYLVMGQVYIQTQQYEEAMDIFERALMIEPDNFESHNDNVNQMVDNGDILGAIDLMQQIIIEENGQFPTTFVRLADMYSQLGKDDEAVNSYKKALEVHPGYLEAAVKLGTQHMRVQRYYEAAAMFNYATEINDRIIAAYIGLGVAQKYSGRGELAEDTFELAGALEPNTNLLFAEMNRLHIKLAMSQYQENDFTTGGLDYANEDPSAKNDLLDSQLERYSKALENNPNQADLNYNFALLLRSKGKVDETIRHLENALVTNPAFQKARIKLGLALREKGKHNEACEQFVKSMLIDQDHCDLHYKLALMYCDRIQFALALEHFESDPEVVQSNTNISSNLTLALQNMGLIDRAAAAWRAVCELEPESSLAFHAQRSIKPIDSHII